tara:strand:+ start:2402 stop:2614 length:213 start_codon:yes stop_codon:yes gene_type:complete
MAMVYEHSRLDGDERFHVSLDGSVLIVAVTGEGIIMDVYDDDDLLGTVGMMFEEWAEWVISDKQQEEYGK